MTAVLSEAQVQALEAVKSAGEPPDDEGTTAKLSQLKRMGLVESERTGKGTTYKLTEAGKVALKDKTDRASQPDAPEDEGTSGA